MFGRVRQPWEFHQAILAIVSGFKSYIRYNSRRFSTGRSPVCSEPKNRLILPSTEGARMADNSPKQMFILGLTQDGRTFRPSDWAERLAGVMAQFRPGGATSLGGHIAYSPWCVPTVVDGVKCVVVHSDLRESEPMAWDFCVNFAKDNNLQVTEGCLLPDAPKG